MGWLSRPGLLARLGFHGLEHVEEALLLSLVTGDPALLVGRHGTAKTALCVALARVLGLDFQAYDAAKALFEDVVGFPNPAKLAEGEIDYVPTPLSLWEKQFILVDELSRAQPQMQNKWLEVIRSRRLMGKPLEKLRYVFAAMNPTSYLGAVPLDEALVSRFAVIVTMPRVVDMDPECARRVIAATTDDDAPLLEAVHEPVDEDELEAMGRRLRSILTGARARYGAVNGAFGDRVVTYVHEVSRRLAERGFELDGRRLGMLRRNLLVAMALALGDRLEDGVRLDADTLAEALPTGLVRGIWESVLNVSLPYAASSEETPSIDLLATIHRVAADSALSGELDGRRRQTGVAAGAGSVADSGVPPQVEGVVAASWRVTEYAASLSQLTLEEHYQEINALLEAVKTAEPGRLPQAWRDLRVLAQVVAERVQEVPWQAAEHFLDAFVGIWGIRGLDGEALAEACLRAGADPGQPSQARLARLCLGQVEEDGPGDPDSAASLMRRLSRESI